MYNEYGALAGIAYNAVYVISLSLTETPVGSGLQTSFGSFSVGGEIDVPSG